MIKTAVTKKLNALEAEIRILKTAVQGQPNFALDEANWKKIQPVLKVARRAVSKEVYG